MSENPQRLRDAALQFHGLADRTLARCPDRPACWAHRTTADAYRSLASDFHQRALRIEQREVSR